MKHRGILYALVLLVVLQILTLKIARDLQYAEVLGDPLFGRLYTVDNFFRWASLKGWRVEGAYKQMMYYLYAFFGILFFIEYVFILRHKKNKNIYTHGTARWATEQEAEEWWFSSTNRKGVVLGQTWDAKFKRRRKKGVDSETVTMKQDGRILKGNSDTHILLTAPTRTGKGVGVIIPTLFNWNGSVIVIDIKGENYELTSGRRSKFSKILRFAPGERRTHRFNPLSEIDSKSEDATKQIEQVVDILVDPQGTGRKDHWQNSAGGLLITVIRYLLEKNTKENKQRFDMYFLLYLEEKPHKHISRRYYLGVRTCGH